MESTTWSVACPSTHCLACPPSTGQPVALRVAGGVPLSAAYHVLYPTKTSCASVAAVALFVLGLALTRARVSLRVCVHDQPGRVLGYWAIGKQIRANTPRGEPNHFVVSLSSSHRPWPSSSGPARCFIDFTHALTPARTVYIRLCMLLAVESTLHCLHCLLPR